jgi:hypothetical protein
MTERKADSENILFLKPIWIGKPPIDYMDFLREKLYPYIQHNPDSLFTSDFPLFVQRSFPSFAKYTLKEQHEIQLHMLWEGFVSRVIMEHELVDLLKEYRRGNRNQKIPLDVWLEKELKEYPADAIVRWLLHIVTALRSCAGKDGKLNLDLPIAFTDILSADADMIDKVKENPTAFAVVLLDEKTKRYLGHVYTWLDASTKHRDQCNMIGIRTSLENLLLGMNKCSSAAKGLARRIAEGVQRRCLLSCQPRKDQKDHTCLLRVIQPLGPMPHILSQIGFFPVQVKNIFAGPGDFYYDHPTKDESYKVPLITEGKTSNYDFLARLSRTG